MTADVNAPEATTPTDSVPKPRLPFIVCVLIAMVTMFANYVIALPLQVVLGKFGLPGKSEALQVAFGLGFGLVVMATALVLVGLLTRWVLHGRLRDIGLVWTKDSWWLFLAGWAASFSVKTLSRLVVPLTGVAHNSPFPWHEVPAGILIASIFLKITAGVAMQGLPEELTWRGWLMHTLAERPRTALVVSATVFGLMHFVSNGSEANKFVYMLQAAAFAFCAGALGLRLRSLWAAVGVHGGLHLTNLVDPMMGLSADTPWVWAMESTLYIVVGLIALAGWKGTRVSYTR